MSVLRFPEWQKPCEDALLEPDPEKLFQRVLVAETAIFRRLHGLARGPENTELEAMDEMLNSLRCLVANTFMLPDVVERVTKRPLRIPNSRPWPNEQKGQRSDLHGRKKAGETRP
jgi:hypothetical protein